MNIFKRFFNKAMQLLRGHSNSSSGTSYRKNKFTPLTWFITPIFSTCLIAAYRLPYIYTPYLLLFAGFLVFFGLAMYVIMYFTDSKSLSSEKFIIEDKMLDIFASKDSGALNITDIRQAITPDEFLNKNNND
jgi:hypothetical protein